MLDTSDIPDGQEGHDDLVTATALMRLCKGLPEFAMQLHVDAARVVDYRFAVKCLRVLGDRIEARGNAKFGHAMTADPAEDEELAARVIAALIDPRPGLNGQRSKMADCDWDDSRALRGRGSGAPGRTSTW